MLEEIGNNNPGRTSNIGMLVSNGKEIYRICTPELYFEDVNFMAGSGDLCTSIFLSRYLENNDICYALEKTASSIFGIMEATQKAKSRELLLIAAQYKLVNPSHTFRAVQM